MKQVKPVVAGYEQVGFNGKPWCSELSFIMSKERMIATAKCELRDTGKKSRFRVVYA